MTEQAYKNIYRIYVPLTGNPLKSLNSYLIKAEGTGKNLLIDTGFNCEECLEALLAGMAELGATAENTDAFLSHMHSDHCGNAAALQKLGMKLLMTEPDYRFMNRLDWQPRGLWYAAEGMPAEVWKDSLNKNPAAQYVSGPFDIVPLNDRDTLEYGGYTLRCIVTPGHTPGHMCLYIPEEKLLFSGDHVLFDITPNICAVAPGDDMLGEYLSSLEKIRKLDIGDPFIDTVGVTIQKLMNVDFNWHLYCMILFELERGSRIDALEAHHQKRLEEVLDIVRRSDGINAYTLTGLMRWNIRAKSWEDFPAGQKWFAMGEALAHIYRLCVLGKVRRELLDDGHVVYHAV